jgi:hypothetical protein
MEREASLVTEQRTGVPAETTSGTAGTLRQAPYLFIVGCARSGTTLLHRLVDAHPLIAISPEMHWITHRFKKWKQPASDGLVTPELASELAEHRRFGRLEIGREEFDGLLGSGEPVPYRSFLEGIFGLYGRAKNKPLVGNKTPAYVRSIPGLHALWPEAKFVHIIRDGRNVCLSVTNWDKADRNAGRYATWEEDPVSTTALWWERKARLGRESGASLEPELYHEVRYEKLVSRPEEELADLCDFLEISYDNAMLRFHEGRQKPVLDARENAKHAWLPATPGLRDWRSQMPSEDVERFEAAAGGLLDELGYPRAAPDPQGEMLENAARVRDSFVRDVLARSERLPEAWET